MNQQEFRSRVRRLQEMIDAELKRRGVNHVNPQEETKQTRYIDIDDENIIDAEFWEVIEEPKPSRGRRSQRITGVVLAALITGFLLGAVV